MAVISANFTTKKQEQQIDINYQCFIITVTGRLLTRADKNVFYSEGYLVRQLGYQRQGHLLVATFLPAVYMS
jgi:hypothetical protein